MRKFGRGKGRRGCAVLLFCASAGLPSQAQTVNILASFNAFDGSQPFLGPLLQGTDGNLYGTTASGGANNKGTVFEITLAGVLTTVYSFSGSSGANPLNGNYGVNPTAGLIQATDGNLYGTTNAGGTNGDGTFSKSPRRER